MHRIYSSADVARLDFSKRLLLSLERMGYGDSATKLAEAFNSRSVADSVTVHGARKWLIGGSIPTQQRILVLAKWLRVDVGWLRFGISEGVTSEPAVEDIELNCLHSDLDLLNDSERIIVRGLVDAILKARKHSA